VCYSSSTRRLPANISNIDNRDPILGLVPRLLVSRLGLVPVPVHDLRLDSGEI
jgi:hypothetical protein